MVDIPLPEFQNILLSLLFLAILIPDRECAKTTIANAKYNSRAPFVSFV